MGSYSVCLSTLGACFGFGGSDLYTWVRSSILDINENHDSSSCNINQPHTSTIRSNQYTLEQAPLLSLCLLLSCIYLTVAWLSVCCINLWPTLPQITNCSYQRFYKFTCRTYLFVTFVSLCRVWCWTDLFILSRMPPLMRVWRVSSPRFVTCMACGAWTNTSLSCTKVRKSHYTGKR